MRVAVTGATGFVGRVVVGRLLRSGHGVRVLVRPGSNEAEARASAEVTLGDVGNMESVRALVAGCDVVIHLAATASTSSDLGDTVVGGTRNVVAACEDAAVTRLVFVSCQGADAAAHSPLYISRWKAETLVRGSAVPYTILRPSLVMGGGDGVTAPLAWLIRTWPVIPVPGTGLQRVQPMDVEDLARCVALAMETDSLLGETVSVGGPNYLTFRQIVDLLGVHLGRIKPKVLIPESALPIVSRALPRAVRPLYLQPRVYRFQHGVVASPGSVPRMFGFQPRNVITQIESYLS